MLVEDIAILLNFFNNLKKTCLHQADLLPICLLFALSEEFLLLDVFLGIPLGLLFLKGICRLELRPDSRRLLLGNLRIL